MTLPTRCPGCGKPHRVPPLPVASWCGPCEARIRAVARTTVPGVLGRALHWVVSPLLFMACDLELQGEEIAEDLLRLPSWFGRRHMV